MRYNKLILSILLILSLGITGLQAQSTLYVKVNAGTQTAYALSNIRKLTFEPENMTVLKSNGNSDNYNLGNIRYLSFTDFASGVYLPGIMGKCGFTIYPNPVTDELRINYNNLNNRILQIEIIEIKGRVVYNQTIDSPQGQQFATVNLSQLPDGLYICRLQYDNKVESVKFVKN